MTSCVLILTIVLFVFGVCECGCPDAWASFQGSCYLYSHERKSFTEAEHYCLQHEAHLVKIDTDDEDLFIKAFASDLKAGHRWIGLTDVDIEGLWKWSDGTKATYFNWYPGEPNGNKTAGCVFLPFSAQYQWINVACSNMFLPICEKVEPKCTCGSAIVG